MKESDVLLPWAAQSLSEVQIRVTDLVAQVRAGRGALAMLLLAAWVMAGRPSDTVAVWAEVLVVQGPCCSTGSS